MAVLQAGFSIDDSLGYLMAKTGAKLKLFFHKEFAAKGVDISLEQFGVLKMISENEGINQKELSLVCNKDKPNITRIVDTLLNKGLIFRNSSQSDKRSFLLHISDDGKNKLANILPIYLATYERIWSTIDKKERQELKKILTKLSVNISLCSLKQPKKEKNVPRQP